MKSDQVVVSEATKNPSILSNIQLLTTKSLQKQRKRIRCQGGVKENILELNLKNKEIIHSLLKEMISME
jgi:hypothetical protein